LSRKGSCCEAVSDFQLRDKEQIARGARFKSIWGIMGMVLLCLLSSLVLHSPRRFAPTTIDQSIYKKAGGLTICERCRKNCAIASGILARSAASTAANWPQLWAVIRFVTDCQLLASSMSRRARHS